jgi:hypothetical protein
VKIVLDRRRARPHEGRQEVAQTADTELGYVLQTRPETPEEFRARLTEAIAESPIATSRAATVVRLEPRAGRRDVRRLAARPADPRGGARRRGSRATRTRACATARPAPFFDVARFPKPENLAEVLDAIRELTTTDHEVQDAGRRHARLARAARSGSSGLRGAKVDS